MAPLYHDSPTLLTLDSQVIDSRPGAVRLAASPFYPGGGGQLPDRGVLETANGIYEVIGFEVSAAGDHWHLLGGVADAIQGTLVARVDRAVRETMQQLHTTLHVVNALVFQAYGGALVTGVQMNADATARIDFDLPSPDVEALRQLEPAVNEVLARHLPVSDALVPLAEAQAEHGLLRSQSVAPAPDADGRIRVVRIGDVDRQACGGTHVATTALCPPMRILKIDNKGRHNRRIRLALEGSARAR